MVPELEMKGHAVVVVKRATAEDWRALRLVRLSALADSPSAFGSSLDEEEGLGESVWRQWASSGVVFLALVEDSPVGMVAALDGESSEDRRLVALWVQLREVRVRDFVRVPLPVLLVSRAAPEGVEAKVTKSGKSRRVPVADRVLPLVQACAAEKGPDDLLFTTRTGHQLHASAVKRSVAWSTVAPGRRIHDLRHTAACLWLSKGVDPVTVQAWLGHASIATTNIYLHHLGSSADRAGLERLNALGGAGGAHPERNVE
jgi:hypothetical protein